LVFLSQTVTICTTLTKNIKRPDETKQPTFLACIAIGDEGSNVLKILREKFQGLEATALRFSASRRKGGVFSKHWKIKWVQAQPASKSWKNA